MKCRNGFVSNSSSSSFIIVGKYMSEADILSHPMIDPNFVKNVKISSFCEEVFTQDYKIFTDRDLECYGFVDYECSQPDGRYAVGIVVEDVSEGYGGELSSVSDFVRKLEEAEDHMIALGFDASDLKVINDGKSN